MKKFKLTGLLLIGLLGITVFGATAMAATKAWPKVKVGYGGGTCEAPFYVAYEKGYFKAEGVDVELVKSEFDAAKEQLATGKLDVSNGIPLQWIKPIEQGLDIVYTGGVHTGCIKLLADSKSKIRSVKDLKGKSIGVPQLGGGAFQLTSRALTSEDIDIKKDITWKVFPANELETALAKDEVDAVALFDPQAQQVAESGKGRVILDSGKTKDYRQNYCCVVVIRGKLVREYPDLAAAITRAILKAAQYVDKHEDEVARLMVEKKYVGESVAFNASLLKTYQFIPSVEGGQLAVIDAAKAVKESGALNPETDPAALAKKAFVKLPGIGF